MAMANHAAHPPTLLSRVAESLVDLDYWIHQEWRHRADQIARVAVVALVVASLVMVFLGCWVLWPGSALWTSGLILLAAFAVAWKLMGGEKP